MQYLGDFSEDDTVYIPFNTFSSDDPQASVTITNLADADIKVHKDGSTTEIVTDGATVAIDFDGVTGNHLVTIDTSAHADYSVGSDYIVRMEGTTVDAGTVNAFIGSFSIENRHSAGALRPTTAGRTLDVTATGAAGIDWGNVENPTTAVDLSGTDIQLCDTITTYTGNTVQTGDSYARLGAPSGASVSADIADVPTVSEFNARTLAAADYFDPAADTVANVTLVATTNTNADMRGTDSAFLAASAPTNFSDLSITSTTGLIDITQAAADKVWGTTTRVLTANTNLNDPTAAVITDAVWDELLSGHAISGSSGEALSAAGTAGDPWTTSLPGAYGAGTAGNIVGNNLDVASSTLSTQASVDTIDGIVDDILLDTAEIGAAGAGLTDLGGMSTAMQTEVNAECDTAINDASLATSAALATVDANVDSILVDTGTTLPDLLQEQGILKNAAFSNFEFLMVLASDGQTPATGLTVTGQRSIDGGAFASVGGTITEVSNGIYQFDALAVDTNGDVITWRFSSGTANDTFVTFKTVQ